MRKGSHNPCKATRPMAAGQPPRSCERFGPEARWEQSTQHGQRAQRAQRRALMATASQLGSSSLSPSSIIAASWRRRSSMCHPAPPLLPLRTNSNCPAQPRATQEKLKICRGEQKRKSTGTGSRQGQARRGAESPPHAPAVLEAPRPLLAPLALGAGPPIAVCTAGAAGGQQGQGAPSATSLCGDVEAGVDQGKRRKEAAQ
jgi:hypothetical protein